MLHIAPGEFAGESLKAALRRAGREGDVLAFRDDLSCGPIDPDNPTIRASWWDKFYEKLDAAGNFASFWTRATTADEATVVWFSRHAASELAFLHAWVERMGDRPYRVVDVTGRQLPWLDRHGQTSTGGPYPAVGVISPVGLASLVGTERPLDPQEREALRERWRHLRRENAPFRVIAEDGLVSAPIDHFDSLILAEASAQWQKVRLVIGMTLGHRMDPYIQTGDMMLSARIIALIEEGRLIAQNGAADFDYDTLIRLPG